MDKPIKIYENGGLIGEYSYESYAAIQLDTPEERLAAMIEAHRGETRAEVESLRQQLADLQAQLVSLRGVVRAAKELVPKSSSAYLNFYRVLASALSSHESKYGKVFNDEV